MPAPTPKPRRFTVEHFADGHRLDRYTQLRCVDLSRSRCTQLIRGGWITINGEAAKPATAVHTGDAVDVVIPAAIPSELTPQDIPLAIVYQDEEMLVIDKPAGLTVHPAPGHPDGTLVNALLHLVPDLPGIGGTQRPGIVHRLDKDTSGLMMVAKTERALVGLMRQLKERVVRKTYLALVTGNVEKDEGEINAPIGRNPHNRKKMAVVRGGRDALTRYVVRQRWTVRGEHYTLVEASPHTGRTHQIRVHMAHIGHPLVGDMLYGKRSPLVERHFLHAARLGFYLPPGEQEWREFQAPLPPDLHAALDALAG